MNILAILNVSEKKHARRSRITMGRSNKKEENLDGFESWLLFA